MTTKKSEEVVKVEEVPFIVSGETMKDLSIAERVEKLTNLGINTNIPEDSVTESFLPELFEVIDIQVADYKITDLVSKKVNESKGLRIIAKDEHGIISSCSKSRCTGLFLPMTESRQFPNLAEIGSDSNGNVTLFNRVRLSIFPSNNAQLFDLIGKKFTAKKVNVFSVPFKKKYTSKNEALDLVKAATAYEVKAI